MMLCNTLKTSNNQTGIPPANHQGINEERTPIKKCSYLCKKIK